MISKTYNQFRESIIKLQRKVIAKVILVKINLKVFEFETSKIFIR